MSKANVPVGFDWQPWVDRWERMQERYLVGRSERFAIMIRMIRETQSSVSHVLDLGCGPGSLTVQLLEAFPQAEVVGVDLDPTLLVLAKARLEKFGARAKLINADLREMSWANLVPAPFDAIVSATALHWLSPEQLSNLYGSVSQVLRPGGIFLNADHVGSEFPLIQQAWDKHRDKLLSGNSAADDWNGFWKAYANALGENIEAVQQRLAGTWEKGIEAGMPLAWHFHTLKANGFRHVDCFWRSDGDAVYGGIKSEADSQVQRWETQ